MSGTSYRVTEEHTHTITALAAAAEAAGWRAKVGWVPQPDIDVDYVEVHLGPVDPEPLEHATVAWSTRGGQLAVRPGWPITVDQVGPYIAVYQARRGRFGVGGHDGLLAIYRQVTGRNPYAKR